MEYLIITILWITPVLSFHEKPAIYIAGLFPVSGVKEQGDIGRGVLPAVYLALDHVNSHGTILPNHELKLIFNDTKVRFYMDYQRCTQSAALRLSCVPAIFAITRGQMPHISSESPYSLQRDNCNCQISSLYFMLWAPFLGTMRPWGPTFKILDASLDYTYYLRIYFSFIFTSCPNSFVLQPGISPGITSSLK